MDDEQIEKRGSAMERSIPTPDRPIFSEQKTAEAASVFLHLNNGQMNYMKLLKLLYLADRAAIEQWERPITNDHYASMDQGPIPSTTYNVVKRTAVGHGELWNAVIEGQGRYEVRLRGEPLESKKLSQAEIDLIHQIFEKYGGWDPFDLVDFTHTLPEYEDPKGSSLPIRMETILKALRFSDEDIERIDVELEEEAQIDAILDI